MNELAIRDERHYLATVEGIRALAERIDRVGDAKDLADRARAAQVWAERARLGQEQVNLAAVAKLWAERRAGELLSMTRESGERATGAGARELQGATLADLGVSKSQSSRWQKLAGIPVERFSEVVDDALKGGRVTLQEVFRRADRAGRERAVREREEQLRAQLDAAAWDVSVSDIRRFDPGLVDAIVTDPPYVTSDAVELYAALRDFALRALKPGGALVAMTWQPILPAVLRVLDHPDLQYRWAIDWASGAHESTADFPRRVYSRWKPVLVYHHGRWDSDSGMVTDVVSSGRDLEKTEHPWQQGLDGFRQLVRAVSRPGELVCDPFLGAGTTALAALSEKRCFVGCDVDELAIAATRRRLVA